ncbi:FAD synthetase family protein [Peribacillus asahii]|uniref:FAD synthase n=1 Tax=Peribacillus asahii TaxID=228899 RepID=A0A3Q9RRK6_9BACI|nr:FAD synthetase family protein [Peribacillus asahii]AZV45230.1 bifunctional riboflavin kinase/FMN adenylyltransferase [Peribacillus asahii]USK84833.1 FAD synthetase family protein [Peribacillus asahii]
METIHINRKNLHNWQKQSVPTVVALGYFDGLHKGHCHVIETARLKAKEYGLPLSVMSFSPHPKIVLSNGKEQVHCLMPLSEKEEKMKTLGADNFYLVKFDKEFASLSPERFVEEYLVNLGVVHAVAGFDFSYGSFGAGNLDRLKQDSKGKIDVTKVQKVSCRGEKISSTCIRKRILAGNVEELPDFLGHLYEVKCNWNGFLLQPQPHYTIPAPGIYEVILKRETKELIGQLYVTDDGLLQFAQNIPNQMKGTLTIVWKKRISVTPSYKLEKVMNN